MRNMGIVRGSAETAIPLFICVDTVFVRSDFRKLPPDDEYGGEIWEYNEIQYDLHEYLQLMAEQNKVLEAAVVELTQIVLGDDSEMTAILNFLTDKVQSGAISIDDVPAKIKPMIVQEELVRRGEQA